MSKSNYNKRKPKKKYAGKKGKKSNTTISKKVDTINKKVNKLQKENDALMGELVYRSIVASVMVAAVNTCLYSFKALNSVSNINDVLAQIRYYDPTIPTLLVNTDFTTGTYFKEIMFELSHMKIKYRSNYQIPVELTVYRCDVRHDTSITPTSAYTSGLADISNGIETNVLLYPSDVVNLNTLWKLKKMRKVTMKPGREVTVNMTIDKSFNYDPSLTDSHNLSFQKVFYGGGIMARVQGVLSHDTAVVEQGLSTGKVDVLTTRTWKVKYSAGADIKYIHVDVTGLSSFTNGPVNTNCPVADNQATAIA